MKGAFHANDNATQNHPLEGGRTVQRGQRERTDDVEGVKSWLVSDASRRCRHPHFGLRKFRAARPLDKLVCENGGVGMFHHRGKVARRVELSQELRRTRRS